MWDSLGEEQKQVRNMQDWTKQSRRGNKQKTGTQSTCYSLTTEEGLSERNHYHLHMCTNKVVLCVNVIYIFSAIWAVLTKQKE